jgi:peptide-methionine (S)-S-oxide reductase
MIPVLRFPQGIGFGGSRVVRDETGGGEMAKATFGAGCFWGVEEEFRKIPGVRDTAVGYSGGSVENPTYKDVCTDGTGHAEVVEVDYDPSAVPFETLLDVFWNGHNPTQLNRQGPDVGTQYRSVIFFHTPEQEAAARASKERLEKSGRFPRPIVTEISPAKPFWRAEEYHQRYFEKRGGGSCHV